MSTLYDVLGLNKDASPLAIKKGYFAMVRKYPPERYPDKFMEIRKAYETLSNEKTRMEYDSISGMSNFVRVSYEQVQKLMEYNEFHKAIPMLEELSVRFPEILTVRSLLGEAYFRNGNNVKAIGLYEQLLKDAPGNAGFAGHLAHAYLSRGWHKKAISAYLKAIELDENNISLWIGLSEAYIDNHDTGNAKNALKKSLEHESDENRDSFGPIYFKLVLLDIESRDINSLRTHLDRMTKIVNEDEEDRENAGWALLNISQQLMGYGMYREARETIYNAEILIPKNKELLKLKKDVNIFLEMERELASLDDDSYDDSFKAMVYRKLFSDDNFDYDSKTSKIMSKMHDYEFLSEINSYRAQINSFREAYPTLYSRIKEFLIQALNPSFNRKLLNQYEKELAKNKKLVTSIMEEAVFDLDDHGDDIEENFFYENQQPIRREEPKIGRNDPCPCGSGKKYKKCCGK